MTESSKATNSEIVKGLVVLTQDFLHAQSGGRDIVRVNPTNLVFQIGQILAEHRRQKDRIEDVMANIERIMKGGG